MGKRPERTEQRDALQDAGTEEVSPKSSPRASQRRKTPLNILAWFLVAVSACLAAANRFWFFQIPAYVVCILASLTVLYIAATIKPSTSVGHAFGLSIKPGKSGLSVVILVLFFNAFAFYNQVFVDQQTAKDLRAHMKREAALEKSLQDLQDRVSRLEPSPRDKALAERISSRARPVDRATALIALGRTDEATRLLKTVVPLSTAERKALYETRALAALYSHNTPECVRWTRKIIRLVPNDRGWLRVHTFACLVDGRVDEAVSTIEKELQITRESVGPPDRFTYDEVWLAASAYRAKDEYSKALNCYAVILASSKDQVHEDDPVLLTPVIGAGTTLVLMGKVPEAEEMYKRACTIWGDRSPREDPDTYITLLDLQGLIAEEHEHYAEAEACYRAEIAVAKEPGCSVHTLGMLNLASLYTDSLGRHREAEALARQAYDTTVSTHSKDSPLLIDILDLRATVYRRLNRKAEAAQMEKRMHEIKGNSGM